MLAANGIKTATFNSISVTLDGVPVSLNNKLASIVKDNEQNAVTYMPTRELLEYLGYTVSWDGQNNTIDLVSNKGIDNDNLDDNAAEFNTIHFDKSVQTNLKDDGEHIIMLGFLLGIQNVANENDSLIKLIYDREAVIRETIVKSLNNTDFETVQKSDFQEKFSTLMVKEINEVLGQDVVNQFFITELFVQ